MNKWTSDETARSSAPCSLSTKSLTECPPSAANKQKYHQLRRSRGRTGHLIHKLLVTSGVTMICPAPYALFPSNQAVLNLDMRTATRAHRYFFSRPPTSAGV